MSGKSVNLVTLLVRGIAGSALIWSGGSKVLAPHAFLDAVLRYEIVGPTLGQLVAILLPWLEVVAGAAILLPAGFARAGAIVAGALSLLFLGAQTSALMRGLEIGCGCLGGAPGDSIGPASVSRAAALLLASAWILVRQNGSAGRPQAQ